MLNSVELVGEIISIPEVLKESAGDEYAAVYLKVSRPFPEKNNVYLDDTFKIVLWKGLAEECQEVCTPGSIVAIRGRLCTKMKLVKQITFMECYVIAEKMSFIQFKPK